MSELDDDGKLKRRFINKRVNAAKEGISFELTFPEYQKLVRKAGLVSSQLGFTGEDYVLARFKDQGPYRLGNCRFITHADNMRERRPARVTKKRIEASKTAAKKALKSHETLKWLGFNVLADAGRLGAAARHAQVKEELESKDRGLRSKKIRVEFVNYPSWGWKTRLREQLNITVRELFGFLRRNPTYIRRL